MASTYNALWPGSVFVVEWDLLDDEGQPMTIATVIGTVTKPSGVTASMDITHASDSATYRASYRPTVAGTHAWKLASEDGGQGVIEGTFVVSRDTTGAPPITTDLSTAVGQIRLLTTDLDEAYPLFTDEQILGLLSLEGGNVKRGAASVLETMSTSELLVSKKISTQDLSIDGPAVAEDLRKRAALLRGQANVEAPAGADVDDGFGFDFVDATPAYPGWYGSGSGYWV